MLIKSKPKRKFTILNLVLASGERLPTLVDAQTWLPVWVATQWATRYRRLRVQASTLEQDLRAIAKTYEWAFCVEKIDFDEFVMSGEIFSAYQIKSLSEYLQYGVLEAGDSSTSKEDVILVNNSLDRELSTIESLLCWSLEFINRAGGKELSLEEMATARSHYAHTFDGCRLGTVSSTRIEPISDEDIEKIRFTIKPYKQNGKWVFPARGFSPSCAIRNWTMFELALDLGLRRGEMLKLRLEDLIKQGREGIEVRRRPDDLLDSRVREPAVKSRERRLIASPRLLEALDIYTQTPPPLGRVAGGTPYLFTANNGDPISLETANSIVAAMSCKSGVKFSWHSLRHTWAEKLAQMLLDEPNGIHDLMEMGGWSKPASAKRYIEYASQKRANKLRQAYYNKLYSED